VLYVYSYSKSLFRYNLTVLQQIVISLECCRGVLMFSLNIIGMTLSIQDDVISIRVVILGPQIHTCCFIHCFSPTSNKDCSLLFGIGSQVLPVHLLRVFAIITFTAGAYIYDCIHSHFLGCNIYNRWLSFYHPMAFSKAYEFQKVLY
jgi:hypothetical protein